MVKYFEIFVVALLILQFVFQKQTPDWVKIASSITLLLMTYWSLTKEVKNP